MTAKPAIPSLFLIPSETRFDYKTLYATAVAYADSGLLISNQAKHTDRLELTFPAVVCSSFAIELFMKFFLMLDKSDKGDETLKNDSGHNLSKLWEKINQEHKSIIAGMFRNNTGTPWLNASERRIELFEQQLSGLGDTPFVQWRYVYEMTDSALMSHGAITLILDAFGYVSHP